MEIVYTKKFIKELSKLSESIKSKVRDRLAVFCANENDPLLSNHKLNPPWEGYRSINVTGDIRIIYKKDSLSWTLYRIGKHSQLYS